MRGPDAWGHHIIYDYDTLAELLESSGFRDIRHCEMSQSRSPHEALRSIEGHFHTMPYAHCRLETMILEGRKGQGGARVSAGAGRRRCLGWCVGRGL